MPALAATATGHWAGRVQVVVASFTVSKDQLSLTKALGLDRTEEDVKDAYIKALGLQKYNKGLVDIRTDEIWFCRKKVSATIVDADAFSA